MIDIDAAFALVRNAAKPLGREQLHPDAALGRVLASPVVASVNSPPSDVSAMDGYAVVEADLADLPVRLPVKAKIFAGASNPGSLNRGECARIFTGAPMPAGADRVIVQEVVEVDDDAVIFSAPLPSSRHVRKQGNDFTIGTTLLKPGQIMGPRQIVAAAAADQLKIECWRKPKIRILATGDELVEPGTARGRPGTIPESVSYGIAALARQWGGETVGTTRLADSLDDMQQAAKQVIDGVDLIIVTGGASVGERDFAKTMFEPLGLELIFSKIAMKPGKPVWLGRVGDTLVMGLPGNPTSAMVTARLLLAPLVTGLSGRACGDAWRWQQRNLGAPLPANGDRETFGRARLLDNGDAMPLDNQDSSAQHALSQADLLLRRRPVATALGVGDEIETLFF